MKKATLITLLAVAIGQGVFGQSKQKARYFEYTTYFTLTNGCESSSKGTVDTHNGYAIGFDDIKRLTAKWVRPNKIKSIRLGEVREIKKSDMLTKSERFKCPEPIKFLSLDTTTNFSYTSWYPIMSPMIKIQSFPSFSKMDSVILTVKKSQLRWINDSTAVIHKSN